MSLTESYAVGPNEPPVRKITIGDALAEAAAEHPDRIAVIAGTADPAERRQWTYAELLCRAVPAGADGGQGTDDTLQTRRTCGGLGA
jgi:hypothetical protein